MEIDMKFDKFLKMQSSGKFQIKRNQPERNLQANCVEWFRKTYPNLFIFAVPNGGSRNSREAHFLRLSGATAGVSDLIAVGNGKVLFIEMKVGKGRQSEYQKNFQSFVERLGHRYVICRSIQQFIKEVELWA